MPIPMLLLSIPLWAAQDPAALDPWAGLPEAAGPALAELRHGHQILPPLPLDADPAEIARERLAAGAPAYAGFTVLLEQPPSLSCTRRVLLERTLDGYPVAGETVRVNWLRDGRILLVDGTSAVAAYSGAPRLDAGLAADAAQRGYHPRWPLTAAGSRLEILPLASGARLAWRVDLASPASDAIGFRHWIDAETGAPLATEDRVVHGNGTGYTFLPNPVQDLDDPDLDDQNNSATAVPAAAYHPVALLDLDGSGYLTGPWATTDATAGRTNRANLDFSANRSKRVFEEVLGYYHVDTFQRYLQSLGLTARQQRQRIDVYDLLFGIIEYPNASYNPNSGVIAFGTLGVDFAEDADVVVHEYGHAIHHDVQGQLSSGTTENGAMGEGYGDWFGAIAFDDALVGEWVGTDWGGAAGFPAVRRCDGVKHFPGDWAGEVHEDGEIWSAALWELSLMVGADTAVTLVIEGMGMQTQATGFRDAAAFIQLADQQLYGGAHAPYLRGAFARSGLVVPAAGDATLYATARSLVSRKQLNLVLDAPAHPGAAYQVILSQNAVSTATGPPFHTTLDVDLGMLNLSLNTPGMSGDLDAAGRASWSLRVPAGLAWKTRFYAQAMVLDGAGASVVNSAPIGFRAERH